MNVSTVVDILLVEDSPYDAELTIREFQKHGLAGNLYHVTDGEEALNFILGTGRFSGLRDVSILPKVVVLDIQMPKMNGLELLQHIKSTPQLSAMPVVMLTSSKESPDIKTCYELGANSYIVKPVNFENFSATIKNLSHYWLILNQQPL